MWCHAIAHQSNDAEIRGDIAICDESGKIIMEVHGLTARRVFRSSDVREDMDDLVYELQWKHEPLPGRRPKSVADKLRGPSEIIDALRLEAQDLALRLERKKYYDDLEPSTRPIATAYVINALRQLAKRWR